MTSNRPGAQGASLAEKVTNFYACSNDLHTLSYVKAVVCRTHSGGYGQGGDEKIKLLLNCIAVIKKVNFSFNHKKNYLHFQKAKKKLRIRHLNRFLILK